MGEYLEFCTFTKMQSSVLQPDLTEMFRHVCSRATFRVTDEEFDLVEQGFREHWNNSTGLSITAEEFRQIAWSKLHPALKMYYPKSKSDEIITLILDYLFQIGQYRFSD